MQATLQNRKAGLTILNEAGGMCAYVCLQKLTPGPAAAYKAAALSGTIKATRGQPSFFLPLNLQRIL